MNAADLPPAALVAELLQTLREESNALKANDAARLAAAESRKRHVLRQLSSSSPVVPLARK
jgi:hypothetical protein